MDDDREDWDRAWGSASHRRLPDVSKYGFGGRFKMDLGDVIAVTLTVAPVDYAESLYIEDEICPICGVATVGDDRTRISVNPGFATIPNLAFGAWAHSSCLDNCPIISDSTPILW